jgi:heterodisulfide reductase subunit B
MSTTPAATIGYYPGCSLSGTAKEYAASLSAVASALGVQLQEIPGWVCCGATSAHAIDHAATLALAGDTLAKARRAGLTEVLAPCAMCYQRLASAVHEMRHKPGLAQRVAHALGEDPAIGLDQIRPINLLSWLTTLPEQQLQSRIIKPLKGLKVACYYGCLLVRPPKVTGADEVEAPRSMEKILRLLGAEPVRWSMATECCGGSFALSSKSSVLRLGQRIYTSARKAGANVICLACPMCQANLDMRQTEFGVARSEQLPVVYLTQLIGTAFGSPGTTLGYDSHFVPVEPALSAATS